MKIYSLIICLFCLAAAHAQEDKKEAKTESKSPKQHNFSKSHTITLQGNLGASYLPDGNSGVIAYGITGLYEKTFVGLLTIFSGVSYTEITDRENFRSLLSTDSLRQQHVSYRSVTIPIGVALKFGQTKHRLYPLISAAVGPQFNIKNALTAVKSVSLMVEARAGLGVNVIKLLSFETGAVYHGSLTSVRSGEVRHPMLLGWFLGVNVNL